MNKHIKLALIFAAAALAGTGCTVDDYNDAYLDGFDSCLLYTSPSPRD